MMWTRDFDYSDYNSDSYSSGNTSSSVGNNSDTIGKKLASFLCIFESPDSQSFLP